jgi:acetyl esterase/lipase
MFSKPLIKWKKYSANSHSAVLLIHGGVFTEGDETWNAEQAESISIHCQLDVFTIDFSKSSLKDSLRDIKTFYDYLSLQYKDGVGLIGCSSGGFLVLNLLNVLDSAKFITLICPVMNPEKREDMLLATDPSEKNLKIQAQQREYFKSRPYPVADASNRKIDIVAANQDENVPRSLIVDESMRYPNATLCFLDGTHRVCYTHNEVVNDLIKKACANNESFKLV